MSRTILVIDDDQPSCRLMTVIFRANDFNVITAPDGRSGLEAASRGVDVVLLDVRLPDIDGVEVLQQLKASAPELPVIMLTGSRDVRTAVRAIQLGAFDYLPKPIDREELVLTVQRALETRALHQEVRELRRHAGKSASETLSAQMGASPQARAVVEQAGVVAESNFTVLILGETGTGKELVAQAIHQMSGRRSGPFVALDCGAIPEPLLESELFGHEKGAFTGADRRKAGRLGLAEGGTCFLDEIGNLPHSLQAKLLRVLESRQVQPVGATRATPMDVRFIAATNDDLRRCVSEGRFRTDLYFRLAQYTITLPPLRERTADIPHLSQRFLEEASVELRRPIQAIVPDAMQVLCAHTWPGNVRELRNAIRQAVLQTRELVIRADPLRAMLLGAKGAEAAPEAPRAPEQSLREVAVQASRAAERRAIVEALQATGGNKSQTARLLKTDYKTLHIKMRHLGLDARDFQA